MRALAAISRCSAAMMSGRRRSRLGGPSAAARAGARGDRRGGLKLTARQVPGWAPISIVQPIELGLQRRGQGRDGGAHVLPRGLGLMQFALGRQALGNLPLQQGHEVLLHALLAPRPTAMRAPAGRALVR